jgi:hypothetical protein
MKALMLPWTGDSDLCPGWFFRKCKVFNYCTVVSGAAKLLFSEGEIPLAPEIDRECSITFVGIDADVS